MLATQGNTTVPPPPGADDSQQSQQPQQPSLVDRAGAPIQSPPSAPPPSALPSPQSSRQTQPQGEPDSKMDKFRAFVSRISGGGTPAIDRALQQHYARQKAAVDLAHGQLNALAKQYALEKDPQKRADLANQWDVASSNYEKLIGKDKNAKGIWQKQKAVLEHMMGHQAQGQGAQGGSGTQQGSQTVPPPPAGGDQPDWRLQAAAAPIEEAERERVAAHTQAEADKDADFKRAVGMKQTEAKAKQTEKEAEIKATSEARLAEERAKHEAKMQEIDEAAKAKSVHPTTAHKVASAEDKMQRDIEKHDYFSAKKTVDKASEDYDGAIDRQTTMHQNLEAALKGDQQAMLSLTANHIGMTLGAQKGARITRAVWDEAAASAPWWDTKMAKFFHTDANGDRVFDGWKGGVTLTSEQMKQMVALGDQKVSILKDHVDRVKSRYAKELAVKGRGGSVDPPPGSTQRFSVNGRVYNIPADKVKDFKKDHPDAR